MLLQEGMNTMKKNLFYIFSIILVCGFFHFAGIRWGVPDRERINLVFGNEERMKQVMPLMRESYDELKEFQVYNDVRYPGWYNTQEEMKLLFDGKKISVPKEIMNSCRSYLLRSYGADEQAALVSLSKMDPKKLDFNPRLFGYGGMYLYPLGLAVELSSLLGINKVTSDSGFYLLNPEKMGRLFILGRIYGAFFAVMAVLVFYFICLKVYKDQNLSFILTLLFGICPAFVAWSHYLKPYSSGLFWVVLAIWSGWKFKEKENIRWLLLSGLFAGLSFSSLLSYGYVLFFVILLVIFSRINSLLKVKYVIYTGIVFFITYFLCNPYVLINWSNFCDEIVRIGTYWQPLHFIESLKFYLSTSLRYGMGVYLWILLSAGVLLAMTVKPKKEDLLFFCTIVPAFLYFSRTTGQWVHYSLFLYPFIFLLGCRGIQKIKSKKLIYIILFSGVIYTAIYTGSYIRFFWQENIRTEAGYWINKNIPFDSKVGLLEAPSPWRTPPFRLLDYKLVLTGEKKTLAEEKPEYFIVSEYQWLRGFGLPAMKEFLSDYELIKRFEKIQSLMGMKFRYPEVIPYDWCHPNPVILIWKRRG